MDKISLKIINKKIEGEIHLPSSKSICNRLLIINALSGNQSAIHNLSAANDTVILEEILKSTVHSPQSTGILPTVDRRPSTGINCHDAGTVMRFLTAYFAITPGTWKLYGTERMHQRPIGILTEKLKELGADIEYLENNGFPPLLIKGKALKGGTITIDASVSSQYISALMMIAPCIENGLVINLKGKISSQPYITMTAGLMEKMGAEVVIKNNVITISPRRYISKEITAESDWSAASYWYAFAAVSNCEHLFLKGLEANSLQGDRVLAGWMQEFGISTQFTDEGAVLTKTGRMTAGFEKDFSDNPDLAPTFVTLCAALNIPSKFYGLESLSIKESDRTVALATELSKLDIQFIQRDNYWELIPNPALKEINITPEFDTYHDHRMAMALSVFAFVLPEIIINNPSVVKKSYPSFWDDLLA